LRSRPRDSYPIVDWIVSRRVHEYADATGRPVGEGRSAAFQDLRTEMRTCPYAGSRYHHAKPMNFTALQQMPAWPQILEMLAWLSRRSQARYGSGILNSNDLARVTGAGVFLADFLALRRRNLLVSGQIPVTLSGLYKVCLGFQLAYMGERYVKDAAPTELPDADGFLAYVEETELLIGDTEVCAGSPSMIIQAYEAIVGGRATGIEQPPDSYATLEIDWNEFDTFAEHAGELWRELVVYALRTWAFVPQLSDTRLPSDIQERLNERLRGHATQLLAQQTGLLTDIAREVQSHLEIPTPEPNPIDPGEPGYLSTVILKWLHAVCETDVRQYAAIVAEALRGQLGSYELYEEQVLGSLNQHLDRMQHALDFETAAPLTAVALSRVYGRTLRDWCETGIRGEQ
jgi:hypothetical protein